VTPGVSIAKYAICRFSSGTSVTYRLSTCWPSVAVAESSNGAVPGTSTVAL